MLHARTRTPAPAKIALLLLAAFALLPAALGQTARKPAPADQAKEEPPFQEYKGVRIGMSADEARKLLGNPTDKDDKQEVFAISDDES